MSDKTRQLFRYAQGKIEFLTFTPVIRDFIRQGLDAWKAHKKLKEQHGIAMSYRTFARYFKRLKVNMPPATALGPKTRKPASEDKKIPLPLPERKEPGKRFQYSATAAQDKDLI